MIARPRRQTVAGAVAWSAAALDAEVTSVHPLVGGLSPGMARLETTAGVFALRWWDEPGPWPEACLNRQRAVLDALAGTDLPVPRRVASDPEVPASLTSWLPGELDLDPVDPQRWLTALADTLVSIHQVTPPPTLPASDSAADPKTDRDLDWLGDQGLIAEARAVLSTPWSGSPALLHGDYQQFNVVWLDGALSGVIDWPLGGAGDRGLDLGHCRLNLAVLFDADTAMAFLDRYEDVAAVQVSPAADLTELLAYSPAWPSFIPRQVGDRRPVDGPGMADRVRATQQATLRRSG